MARVRQSRPDSWFGCQVQVLKILRVFPNSLGGEWRDVYRLYRGYRGFVLLWSDGRCFELNRLACEIGDARICSRSPMELDEYVSRLQIAALT